MGAQNTKERTVSVGLHSTRAARSRPRPPKDGRQIVSNIFTEHNGMNHYSIVLSTYNTKTLLKICFNLVLCSCRCGYTKSSVN